MIVGSIAGSLVASGLSLRSGTLAAMVATLALAILGVGLPAWIMTSTSYTLGNTMLRIKSGPFQWQIPIQEIQRISPSSNPLSSPALSLDRLRIDYSGGKSILISPKDKGQFLQDLEARRGR